MTTDRRPASSPRFGLFLSQSNKPLSQVYDEFQMAEDLGFDHAWLVDHLVDTDGPPGHPCLEAWTLLAALAARTRGRGGDPGTASRAGLNRSVGGGRLKAGPGGWLRPVGWPVSVIGPPGGHSSARCGHTTVS
jgi:Luciferase-like monooxygenase.